jgi:hypothetical protein
LLVVAAAVIVAVAVVACCCCCLLLLYCCCMLLLYTGMGANWQPSFALSFTVGRHCEDLTGHLPSPGPLLPGVQARQRTWGEEPVLWDSWFWYFPGWSVNTVAAWGR